MIAATGIPAAAAPGVTAAGFAAAAFGLCGGLAVALASGDACRAAARAAPAGLEA